MALSDFVSVSISASSLSVTRPGFGTPLILCADAPEGFTARVQTYTDAADMLTDGFDSDSGTYLAAVRLCEQNPRPDKFKVGRLENIPTQRFELTPVAANSTKYGLTLDGTDYSVTSDTDATATEIVTALKTALGSPDDVAVSGSTTLVLTVSTAGAFHSVKSADIARLGLAQTHSDPGTDDDLDAILLEDPDFYGIQYQFNSKDVVTTIAAWAETNEKLYIAQTQDSVCATVAGADANDVMSALKGQGYFYSAALYSESTDAFADAAWLGAVLPTDPGSEQWGLWTLVGVTASALTESQYANVVDSHRLGNVYLANIAGKSITAPGKVASGEWIDVVRFRDWLRINMALDVFDALQKAVQQGKKVPFTDEGISAIRGVLESRLDKGVKAGGLSSNPAPVVKVPKASDVSDDDKAARTLTGVTFTATLAGAIIAVKPIRGTITV